MDLGVVYESTINTPQACTAAIRTVEANAEFYPVFIVMP